MVENVDWQKTISILLEIVSVRYDIYIINYFYVTMLHNFIFFQNNHKSSDIYMYIKIQKYYHQTFVLRNTALICQTRQNLSWSMTSIILYSALMAGLSALLNSESYTHGNFIWQNYIFILVFTIFVSSNHDNTSIAKQTLDKIS